MLKTFFIRLYRSLPVIRECSEIHKLLKRFEKDQRARQAIQLCDFDLHDHPRYSDARRLPIHQAQICSQNGEDGIIREIFRRIGTTDKTFAEIGVGNGYENNTSFLLSQGWTGFWIDGKRSFLRALKDRKDLGGDCIKHSVSFVTRENIKELFLELDVPLEFDLLSLDIDQNTFFAWEGLRDFQPRVVVVEYNSALPSDLDWKVHYLPDRTWDFTQNFGASLKAFENLGRDMGYSLVGCDLLGINAFFVRNDLLGDHFLSPFSSENHYEPPRFQFRHRRGHLPAILDRAD
jgi:hypothetical protein